MIKWNSIIGDDIVNKKLVTNNCYYINYDLNLTFSKDYSLLDIHIQSKNDIKIYI